MTPETLRELEVLYERATPGEWQFHNHGLTHWITCNDDYHQILKSGNALSAEADERNAALVVALHNQWPSIAAALRERDEQHALLEEHRQQYADARLELIAVRRERDELKAECERLRAALSNVREHLICGKKPRDWDYNCRCSECGTSTAYPKDLIDAALTPPKQEKQT